MAEFNPVVGTVDPPNYTTRAPDIGPNKAFESLFSGIGSAIDAGAKTGDAYVQSKIENDARYGFDSLNNDLGVSVDSTSRKPGEINPPELTQSQEGLSKLAQAMQQGKVTQEYYYQRLAATAKNLRAKYPGFEKQVDDIVQNVTGTRPANAYRDALFQNLNNFETAQASKADMANKWLLKDQNMGLATVMFPGILEKWDTLDDNQKRKVMTEVETQQGKVQLSKNAQAINDADVSISKPAVSAHVRNLIQPYLTGAVNGTTIGEGAQSMVQKALSDGAISPDEKAQINAYIADVKIKAATDVRTSRARDGWGKNFSEADVNKFIEDSLAPLTEIDTLVNSGKVDVAIQQAEKLKAMGDERTLKVFEKFPELVTAEALRPFSEPGADRIVQEVIDREGGGLKFNERVLASSVTKAVLSGQWTNADVVERLGAAEGMNTAQKEALIGEAINRPLDALATGKLLPDAVEKYVDMNFNKSIDTLFKSVDASTTEGVSQRLRLYQKMFDPKITKAIVASGSEKALKTYLAAAMDKAQSIPEFKVAAKELEAAGTNVNYGEYLTVTYDKATNRMRVMADLTKMNLHDTNRANPAMASDIMKRNDISVTRLKNAVQSYNSVLNNISPILEATGQDELEEVKKFTRSLSVNLSGGDETGFFKFLADESEAIEAPDKGTKDEGGRGSQQTDVSGDLGTDDPNDPIEWDLGDSEDVIQGVLDAGEKGLKPASLLEVPKDQTSEAFKTFDKGLAALTTSTKRGYKPDLSGLRPAFRSSVSALQEEFGEPLTIVSGYRDAARNKRAGGAKRSQHMHGNAVDIDVSGWSRDKRVKLIKAARDAGFGGIGVYPNSLHIDMGRTRAWGPSYRNSSLPKWAREVL